MSTKSFVVVLAVLAAVGLLGFGLLSKGEAKLSIGEAAPDKTLETLDGSGSGRIADYRGRWVLVNFWASWCDPCKSEAPALEEFQQANRARALTVLGVNLFDSTDHARAFVQRYRLTYPQLHESGGDDRKEAYGMTGFPENFLVDPEGKIALIRRGPVDREYLDRNVLPLIRSRS